MGARATRAPRSAARVLNLTACYSHTPDGWYVAEVLESRNVYTQGKTMAEVRRNLTEAVTLLLGDMSLEDLYGHRRKHTVTRKGDPTELVILVLPG